jgi:hypothetical protein
MAHGGAAWPARLKGYGIIPGGQSGNPGSFYYDDMLKTWQEGKLKELLFLQSATEKSTRIKTNINTKQINYAVPCNTVIGIYKRLPFPMVGSCILAFGAALYFGKKSAGRFGRALQASHWPG